MMFFYTRKAARDFAKSAKQVIDRGTSFAKRWGVKVV